MWFFFEYRYVYYKQRGRKNVTKRWTTKVYTYTYGKLYIQQVVSRFTSRPSLASGFTRLQPEGQERLGGDTHGPASFKGISLERTRAYHIFIKDPTTQGRKWVQCILLSPFVGGKLLQRRRESSRLDLCRNGFTMPSCFTRKLAYIYTIYLWKIQRLKGGSVYYSLLPREKKLLCRRQESCVKRLTTDPRSLSFSLKAWCMSLCFTLKLVCKDTNNMPLNYLVENR